KEELPSVVPVWIRLFGLPTEFWNPVVLQDIGNSIGKFVRAANSTMRMEQMVYAWMCVYVDMNQPLPANILLEIGEERWEQQIDYENIPFRCHLCHEYGHLVKDCPLRIKDPINETLNSDEFVTPPKRKITKEKNAGKVQNNNTNRFASLQTEEAEEDMDVIQETQVLETQMRQTHQKIQDNNQMNSESKAVVVHQGNIGEIK
ncbi:hypothetical protein KI387_030492, partial [Taxus chinensis]